MHPVKALIDGPCTNVCRQALNFKHLKVGPSAKSGPVKNAFEMGEILEKWEKTAWAKKLATKKKRATLTDFAHFKLKLAKQRKNRVLKAELKKLRKEAKV